MERLAFSPVRRALIVVAIMFIATACIVIAKSIGHISQESATRLLLAAVGIMVVIEGNMIPKLLEPLATKGVSSARMQAMKRAAGYANVIGGLGFTLSWLLAPFHLASMGSIVALAGVWSITIALCWFSAQKPNQDDRTDI